MDHEGMFGGAPAHIEHVWLAADLAVLDVILMGAGGFVDEGLDPFAAAGTLIANFTQGS